MYFMNRCTVDTGVRADFAQKSTALLYSDLVRQAVMRQASRHASGEPSCVNRQSVFQTLQSNYSDFSDRQPVRV